MALFYSATTSTLASDTTRKGNDAAKIRNKGTAP